jgi:hypothetical protein
MNNILDSTKEKLGIENKTTLAYFNNVKALARETHTLRQPGIKEKYYFLGGSEDHARRMISTIFKYCHNIIRR